MSVLTEANADHRFHSRSGGQLSRCVSMERNRAFGGDTCAIRGEKKTERERERAIASEVMETLTYSCPEDGSIAGGRALST